MISKREILMLNSIFSGPEVIVTDPATGQARSTGLKTGHMTDLDKINLNQKNTMAQIQGEVNRLET